MPAAAAPAAPPPPRRHRLYTAADPRCKWTRTEDADTLVVDVSGFRKEELKVLYNTRRKLTVTGERQVDGARWARFLKVFPVPRSCDAGAIKAIMDKEGALLYVILPKGATSSSSSSMDKQKEQQPGGSQPRGEQKEGAGSADGSSTGSLWSAQEDAVKDGIEERKTEMEEMKEKRQEEIATQDVPRTDGGDDANAVKKEDGEGESKRWWRKIRPLHALGFVLILALVGVGACVLYVMLLRSMR